MDFIEPLEKKCIECDNKIYAKSLCKSHYNTQWRKTAQCTNCGTNVDYRSHSSLCRKCKYTPKLRKKIGHKSKNRNYSKEKISNIKLKKQLAFAIKNNLSLDQFKLNQKIKRNLRSRLNKALKNNHKSGSAVSDLGCSIQDFRRHLESKFQHGMSWNNYGEWEIDHIKPLSHFDLSDRQQFLEAAHYTNLQPLWWQDNLSKRGKD